MTKKKERRRWKRQSLEKPEIGILYPEHSGEGETAAPVVKDDTLLVYVLNRSEGGFLMESSLPFGEGFSVDMRVRSPDGKGWSSYHGKVVWTDTKPDNQNSYCLGVELRPAETAAIAPVRDGSKPQKRMCPSELEFLSQTQLLDVVPDEARCPLLNCMIPRHVKAGERLITQGEEGDRLYLIQEGSCVVSVEKDGASHAINRLKAGDILGEMALLTGEPRSAHVDAESEMTLWSLARSDFDTLCSEYPDLTEFLTEIITQRFSTERMIAERTLGRYVINEILGRGGWSVVYRGTHSSLNMPVAIKMLKHTMAMNADFSEKFRNEAMTIATLNHENIVKVYDIEELYRTIFIVMEYLEGVSLDYILKNMPKIPFAKVIDILLQVCAGLAYAHEKGIVHQDIKPGNLFIQSDGRARIVDFGLSCPPGTRDFGWPGTVYYMSPEQIEGESVDERTDIYSLGILTYEMVTGQRPYPEDDLARLMDMHVEEDVPDPRNLVPDLPGELLYFIKRATQRDPAGRFKSVWEIMRDLQPFADKMGVERRPQPEQRRKMMSLFLFYQDEQQLTLKRLVEEFSSEIKKLGAELRAADFKDV